MGDQPPPKRPRTTATSSAMPPSSPSLPSPALTLEDIKILQYPLPATIIYDLLQRYPEATAIVSPHVDAEKAKRKADVACELECDRKRAASMDFNVYTKKIGKSIARKPRPGENPEGLALDIEKEIKEAARMMMLGCEASRHYSTRHSAMSAMLEIARLMTECPHEELAEEILGDYEMLEEGPAAVWKLVVQRGEVEMMRRDLAETVEALFRNFGGDAFMRGTFEELAEQFGVAENVKKDWKDSDFSYM